MIKLIMILSKDRILIAVFYLIWKIISKELIIKNKNFKKGERLYARISVEFEETSKYQGKEIKEVYKIEGYLKPIIN